MIHDVFDALTMEFDATLARLAEMVRGIREEDWTTGQEPRLTPVHQVSHVVTVVLQYTRSAADRTDIVIGWKPHERYPLQERLLELIDMARECIPNYVDDACNQALSGRRRRTPPLHRLIYLLRHTIWHLCSLHEELRRRGYRMSSHYTKTWTWARVPDLPGSEATS